MKTDIVVSGLGGQGIFKFSEVVVAAAARTGLFAQSYVHSGLSQLGGPVRSHIRIGEVYSPKIPRGEADLVIALERSEVFRLVPFMSSSTRILVSDAEHPPLPEKLDPSLRASDEVIQRLLEGTAGVCFVPAAAWAAEKGYPPVTANAALLGGLAALAPTLTFSLVQEAFENRIPAATKDANLDLFRKGYQHVRSQTPGLPVE